MTDNPNPDGKGGSQVLSTLDGARGGLAVLPAKQVAAGINELSYDEARGMLRDHSASGKF